MAEIKKYLDTAALSTLVTKIKEEDAKVLSGAKSYADGLASNYDAAGAAAGALADAKAYADGLASNYDVAGAAAAVQEKLDEEVLRAKAAEEANAAAAKKAQDEVDALEIVVQNIQENAYDDTELVNRVVAVETNKADKTQVATDIAAAVKVEEDARKEAVQAVQGEVDALEQTHATDKVALEDAIALKASQEDLDGVSAVANAAVKQSDYDTKVADLEAEDTRIAGLVSTEQARAEGVESGLNERLEEVEAFFKLAEGESLDTALDTLKEIQDYVTGEGAAADQMVSDIAANKKAIEDHIATDHDFAAADDALKSELEGQINAKADSSVVEGIDGRVEVVEGKVGTLEGQVSTLEGQMTTVQGAVATKAEAQDLTNAISTLEGADTGLANRIAVLEAKHGDGEGTVESLIATAKDEAIAEAKADASNKDAVVLAESQKYTDAEIDEVELRVTAVEAKAHEHTNKAELDLIVSGDKAKWDDAAAKAHEHSNKTVLDGITADKVTVWDSVSTKASQEDLDDAIELINANTSAINSFVAITSDEVTALFA